MKVMKRKIKQFNEELLQDYEANSRYRLKLKGRVRRKMYTKLKRFVLLLLLVLALANLRPGDGDKQTSKNDISKQESELKPERSKLSRRTDPGGGINSVRDEMKRSSGNHESSSTLAPKRDQGSETNQLDLYLLAGQSPTTSPESEENSHSNHSSARTTIEPNDNELEEMNQIIASTVSSLSLDPSVSLLESPDIQSDIELLGSSLYGDQLDNQSSTQSSIEESLNDDEIHLKRSRKSPPIIGRDNFTTIQTTTKPIASAIVIKQRSDNSSMKPVGEIRQIKSESENSSINNTLQTVTESNNHKESKMPVSVSITNTYLDPIDYEDFDLDYQLKLNTSSLLPISDSTPSSVSKREYENNNDNGPNQMVTSPTWPSLVGAPSYLFEAGFDNRGGSKNLNHFANLSSSSAASSIGPVPSVLTVKSTQLSRQELNTIKPQFLSLFQDNFDSSGSINGTEINQSNNGDLIATASYIDPYSPNSILFANGSFAQMANLTSDDTNNLNLYNNSQRESIINLLNGSPVLGQQQRFRDFPTVEASEQRPVTSTTTSTTTTTTASPNGKGSSDNNHWFNYPHPRIHHNPLLLHHLINKPALYAPHIDTPLDQTSTTTASSILSSTVAPGLPDNSTQNFNSQVTTPSSALSVIERPTLPSPSRAFNQHLSFNQTQLEMQLNELRALNELQRQQEISRQTQTNNNNNNNNINNNKSNNQADYLSFLVGFNGPTGNRLVVDKANSRLIPSLSQDSQSSLRLDRVQPNISQLSSFYAKKPPQSQFDQFGSFNNRQPVDISPSSNRNQHTGTRPIEMVSQIISAPSLLQEMYALPKGSSVPMRASTAQRYNNLAHVMQSASPSLNHPTHLIDNGNFRLNEMTKQFEKYQNSYGLNSLGAQKNQLGDLEKHWPTNEDDRMSNFVSQLSTLFNANQSNKDIVTESNSNRDSDLIQLFNLSPEDQSKLQNDLLSIVPSFMNRTTDQVTFRPNLQNQKSELELAFRALVNAAVKKLDIAKNKGTSTNVNDKQILIMNFLEDSLKRLMSHRTQSKLGPASPVATKPLIHSSSNHIANTTTQPSIDLHSLGAEQVKSVYVSEGQKLDDQTQSRVTNKHAGQSRANQQERQIVQESLVVESSRINPFAQSQRSTFFAPAPRWSTLPNHHNGLIPTQGHRFYPSPPQPMPPAQSLKIGSSGLFPMASYQMATSQPPPIMSALPPATPLTFAQSQNAQSRPVSQLVIPRPPPPPDPSKLLVDRFPFVSAPAYLVKLPTLTGGTITASGSFQSPASFLRNRGLVSQLRIPPRIRVTTMGTSQQIPFGAPIQPISIQMAPSGLHPMHNSPPAYFSQHQSPFVNYDSDHPVLPSSNAPNYHPGHSAPPIYGQISNIPLAYEHHHQSQYPVNPYAPQSQPVSSTVSANSNIQIQNNQLQSNSAPSSSINNMVQQNQADLGSTTTVSPSYQSNPTNPTSSTENSQTTTPRGNANSIPSEKAKENTLLVPNMGNHQSGNQQHVPSTATSAALARLQQATASLVELTSLASLVDEILTNTDTDPTPGTALVNAINNLSAAHNSAMTAQASSSSGTINDSAHPNQQQNLAATAWKNLLNAGTLWRDKINHNNDNSKIRLEQLMASAAMRKPTTRLRVKYIRVPIAVYETANSESGIYDSPTSNDLLLATRNPISAKSFIGQVSLPAVPLVPGTLEPISSISDQITRGKPGMSNPSSGYTNSPVSEVVNGGSKSASSESYIFDELSSDSSPQLVSVMRDLLGESTNENSGRFGSIRGKPSLDSPIILGLQPRRPVSIQSIIRRPNHESMVSSNSPLASYYSLMTAPNSDEMFAIDTNNEIVVRPKKTRKRGKSLKNHDDDDDDDDVDDDDGVSGNDLMSAADVSLLESLISTVAQPHSQLSPDNHQQGSNHINEYRSPPNKIHSSPWRLKKAFGALRNMGADSSNQVDTYAAAPSSVSTIASVNKANRDFATNLLKHSNRLSIGELIGALGARRIIMSLLNKRKASRTNKRAVEQAGEIYKKKNISKTKRIRLSKLKPSLSNNSTITISKQHNSSSTDRIKGTPSMYPYIGTFEYYPPKSAGVENSQRQQQIAMNMIVNRSRQHSQRNGTRSDMHSKLIKDSGGNFFDHKLTSGGLGKHNEEDRKKVHTTSDGYVVEPFNKL